MNLFKQICIGIGAWTLTLLLLFMISELFLMVRHGAARKMAHPGYEYVIQTKDQPLVKAYKTEKLFHTITISFASVVISTTAVALLYGRKQAIAPPPTKYM